MDRFEQYCMRLEELSSKVFRRLGQEISSMLEEGMSYPQVRLMRLVARKGSATVSEISEEMGVTLSAVTSLADRLKAAGLLARRRDETDRRLVFLKLTEDGQQKLTELEAKRLELMRRYLGRLPEEDVERLIDIFGRVAAIAEETPPRSEG